MCLSCGTVSAISKTLEVSRLTASSNRFAGAPRSWSLSIRRLAVRSKPLLSARTGGARKARVSTSFTLPPSTGGDVIICDLRAAPSGRGGKLREQTCPSR
jgi:hypothetical protein